MKVRLSDAVDDYLVFAKAEGKKAQTLSNMRSVLLKFLAETGNVWTDSLGDHHVTACLTELSRTRSPNSMVEAISVLRRFFDWCRRSRRMPSTLDPMAGRKAPKRVVKERARLHVSKFPALLDAAGRRSPRDRAYIALCLYTLCRTSEITSLRLHQVDLDAEYVLVKVWKSGLEDRVPICTELDRELRRWLTAYAQGVGELKPDMLVVPARRLLVAPGISVKNARTRLEPYRQITHPASQIVKPALDAVGFTIPGQDDLRGEGAHTLRRSAARALFDKLVADGGYDHPLRVVQAQMHHANQSMTEAYIGVSGDRHMRDSILKGKSMFDLPEVPTIGSLRECSEGERAVV